VEATAEARARFRLGRAPAGIGEVSIMTWHDDTDKMVVTFREEGAANGTPDRVMRQYWGRSGDQWRIVAEGKVH
jgi:hypothetical protein